MEIDSTTLRLFSPFHREVGNPERSIIHNVSEFHSFILQNNGVHDCFVSVYPLSGEIDKIFFDFDYEGNLAEAQKVFLYLWEKNIATIPIASGKRGIHLHALLKPETYSSNEARPLLFKASQSILYGALGGPSQSIDCRTLGDIRRLCRIPNTLRPPENRTYATYLPLEFVEFKQQDLDEFILSPHSYDYNLRRRYSLHDLAKNISSNHITQAYSNVCESVCSHEYLRRILRPCLYRLLTTSEPSHEVRVAAAIDLLNMNLSPESICNLFSQLRWSDFNPRITEYQVKNIAGRNFRPYSCASIRRLGLVEKCCP